MQNNVSLWLDQLRQGNPQAMDELVPLLYEDLRRIAHNRLLGERRGHTLETTALVNEAYMKLLRQHRLDPSDRQQFLAAASNTMRRILVDYARTRKRLKRGSGETPITLEDAREVLGEREAEELLDLDQALERLAEMNPLGARVVELRFFIGMTLQETAEVLDTSTKTVQRRWWAARAWLRHQVQDQTLLHEGG